MIDAFVNVLIKNGLITAFAFVGLLVWLSYLLSKHLTRGHIHGSAIAITLGLVLAYFGGAATAEPGRSTSSSSGCTESSPVSENTSLPPKCSA